MINYFQQPKVDGFFATVFLKKIGRFIFRVDLFFKIMFIKLILSLLHFKMVQKKRIRKIRFSIKKIYIKSLKILFKLPDKVCSLAFRIRKIDGKILIWPLTTANFIKYSLVLSAIIVCFSSTIYKNSVSASSSTTQLSDSKSASNLASTSNKPTSILDQSSNMDSNIPIYFMVYPNENTTFSSENIAAVKFIGKKEGDSFKTGDILIEFDCRIQEADLRKSTAQLEFAKIAYRSALKLECYGTISIYELIKAKSEFEIAAAEVDKLQAMIDKCIIRAPYNGSVSASLIHIGETAKPGDPVLKIVNLENLELKMQVPSIWLRWLKVGSEFHATINETQKTVAAKVVRINPEINAISQTVSVIGVFNEPDSNMLPGMSGQAVFSTRKSEIES